MTLVVSVVAWIGCLRTSYASEPSTAENPPPFEREPASRSPSSAGESGTVARTLPNTAPFGPSRRGEWRIDANVPQAPPATEHIYGGDEPTPAPTTPYRRYAAHPYDNGSKGYVLRGSAGANERLPGRLYTGQLAVEGGQSGPAQARTTLALRFGFWRLGFDANVDSHFTGSGTQQRPLRTALVTGSTNAVLAPVLQPKLMWWIGGGLNYAALSPGVRVGPNLTSTINAFPRRPLVMSARADLGVIDGKPVVAGRGSIGFVLKNFELYAGYEARRLGDLLLQGPMVGARAWF
ncbi:MAG: hypothetical protein ACRBN8_19340 [Nannocystales bacterium]